MSKLAIQVLFAGMVLPAFAPSPVTQQKVTAEQLEQALVADRDKPDADLALDLSGLELTQRLSLARMARLEAELPGSKAQQALLAVADESAFLHLPASDTPATAEPERSAKIAILNRAIDYAGRTIPKLPNFFATRETTRFEEALAEASHLAAEPGRRGPLQAVGSASVIVLYRDGHELVEDDAAKTGTKQNKHRPARHELSTAGEFGPILATVLGDAVHGAVTWSHWEQGATGQLAVFHYTVPKETSHYAVTVPGVGRETQETPPYHGEIAVDPADGSILRMTMEAELNPADSVAMADLMVDYGPVEIGGKTYICPVRSVALSRVRMLRRLASDTMHLGAFLGPFQTRLNDVVFKEYHLFRAEMRILTDDAAQPEGNPPASAPATAPQH